MKKMSAITTEFITELEYRRTRGGGGLTLDNPVFCHYLIWTSVLVLKMAFMPLLTAVQRFRSQTFSSEKDLAPTKVAEVKFENERVERVRRCHRNDLETVLPYMIVALLYVTTDPMLGEARLLFRIASVYRILHTAFYAFRPVPQPTRLFMWLMTFIVTGYMAVSVAICTFKFI